MKLKGVNMNFLKRLQCKILGHAWDAIEGELHAFNISCKRCEKYSGAWFNNIANDLMKNPEQDAIHD